MKPVPDTIPRPWLTLDAAEPDVSAAGGRLACWSHVGGRGDLYMVLNEAGVSTEVSDFAARPRVQERLRGREFLLDRARDVLLYLLHGIASGAPVAVAAPIREFAIDGSVAPLLIVVEALLPRAWSETIYMRGFTRTPGLFLDDLKSQLIAVPADAAEAVFEVRREAILLDQYGRPAERQDPRPSARHYASAVCELALQRPELVEAVLDRVSAAIPNPAELPDDIGNVLELACVLSGQETQDKPNLESVLKRYPELIGPRDYPNLSEAALCTVALSERSDIRPSALHEIENRAAEGWAGGWDWDDSLAESPKRTIDAVLAAGQWQEWRRYARCSPDLLHAAAIHWCASPYWRTHEPRLEDWVQVVRDLGDRLQNTDLELMMDREIRSLPFPPIAWFESVQAADLKRLHKPDAALDPPASPTPQPVAEGPPKLQDDVVVSAGAESKRILAKPVRPPQVPAARSMILKLVLWISAAVITGFILNLFWNR